MSNQRLSAYTPSNMPAEQLRRLFVQREKLLELIVNRLTTSMSSGDKHHILLVGPRGSGKTHLVSLAVWELRQKAKLADTMRIAWLGEDDVFSGLIHFAFAIAKSLADEYPDEFPADFKSSVRGLPLDDAAIVVLNSVIKQLKKRHLLLVTENLDQTFTSLGESGQKKLRAFLQETRRIATLSTTQQLFAAVSSRKESFFGFFDTHHLDPLTVDDALQLIRNIAVEQQKADLIRFLDSTHARYRIRALHHLAGGNYRMYVLLAEFLSKDTLDELVSAFETLAEEMTPYFQERMRSLPDQQRQLIKCLCDATGALTVKEISEETFIAEGNCSKQLGHLKSKGYVRSEKRGKESYYDMAEPLMRLCLEIKNQRGRPLKLVSQFLKAWFPEDKLQWSEKMVGIDSRSAEYCRAALQAHHSIEDIINSKLKTEIDRKLRAGRFQQALDLADELSVAAHAEGLLYRATISNEMSDWRSEISALTEVLNSSDADIAQKAESLINRGLTYGRLGETKASLADFSALIEMPDVPLEPRAEALVYRGLTFSQLGDTKAALADYTAVIELDEAPVESRAEALSNRGWTYGQLGNSKAELADYTAVLALPCVPSEQKAKALINRGLTYGQLGDTKAELADYTAVLEIPDVPVEQRVKALVNRGAAYGQIGHFKAERADYSAVINLPSAPVEQRAMALFNRGATYGQLGDAKAALADCTAVIELDNTPVELKAMALVVRGVTHWQLKDWRASIGDFETVLSLSNVPSEVRTQALFGLLGPVVAGCPLQQIQDKFAAAFENGDRQSEHYGGTPNELLMMVLERGPSEWPEYVAAIAPFYIRYGVAEKLGSGLTRTIQFLDEKDFSASQLDIWNQAWKKVGNDSDDLQIPLACLDAAVEILKSDSPNDRPLFRLPLEVRQLVRPLLRKTLRDDKLNSGA